MIPFRLLRHFNVFNADQVSGYEPKIEPAADTIAADDTIVLTVDEYAANTGVERRQVDDMSAYYVPSQDFINIPPAESFKTAAGYAGTVLHELVHATGHKDRLDRKFGLSNGGKDYAAEELVAELGAAMLCGSLGYTAEPRDDHAKYLNSWIKRLEDDPKIIMRAAAAAEKASAFLDDQVQQSTSLEAA